MRPGYFDELYDTADDPFGFGTHPEEAEKFAYTLGVCGDGALGRVLEIGCAVGDFTELLAERSSSVLGIDVSARAVERASARLAAFPNVRCEVGTLPHDFPEGRFDLVVASDVLYYLSTDELVEALRRIEEAIDPGGSLVIVHFVPRMGSVLDGDEVHDLVAARSVLDHAHAEQREFGAGRRYRIDRFVKR
jgi:SAM-dependent methyltransferase